MILDCLDGRCGHTQLFRGNEVESCVEVRHGLNERMCGATIFKVTYEGYFEVFESALCLLDGEQVEHALGWMLIGTVTGINNRYS